MTAGIKVTQALFLMVFTVMLILPPGCSRESTKTPAAQSSDMLQQTVEEDQNSVKGTEYRIERNQSDTPLASCLYFDEASFLNAVSSAVTYETNISGMKGGIVPHHLLAGTMIASFWKTVSLEEYDLIVLIGPDHFRKGRTAVTTITSGFSTIYGDVYSYPKLANALIHQNLASEALDVMQTDHAISSHIPFISYYLPDTPVLPLLVRGNCSAGQIRALAEKLLDATKDIRVLYVASMDFSHYLPLEVANLKDEYTEKVLAEFDEEKVSEMTNDHLDSRPSALFMMNTMKALSAKQLKKWDHSNSDIISKTETGYTTSYFVFGFFPQPQQESENPVTTSIIATGDIMLGRGVEKALKAQKAGFSYSFLKVKEIFANGDIVFGNLEHPLTRREKSLNGNAKIVLKADPDVISGLTFAGFNLLSLANNHVMDYYGEGLMDTIEALDAAGILYAGAGKNLQEARKPAILEKNGVKVGFLAYSEMAYMVYEGNPPLKFAAEAGQAGVAPLTPRFIEEDIRALRPKADLIVISLHWGTEDSYEITEQQIQLAHKLCDQGADIILGHHPHRFQGIEIYNGKPIVYSLGNFIFDQVEQNQESFVLQLDYEGTELAEMKAIPVKTVNHCQIVLQDGQEAEEMLQRQKRLSEELGTSCTIENTTLIYSGNRN